jgi:hypothetical protein
MAAPYQRVTYVGGREVVVRIGPKSQVAWERHFDVSFFDRNRKRTLEQNYWLTWHALIEANEETREFDDWLAVVDDYKSELDTPENPVGDEAVNPEPDPSPKAQPPAI